MRLEALGRGVDQLVLARSPTELAASTWSFMSEMSGLPTSTVPPLARAGIW
jgi:hypothetical protein